MQTKLQLSFFSGNNSLLPEMSSAPFSPFREENVRRECQVIQLGEEEEVEEEAKRERERECVCVCVRERERRRRNGKICNGTGKTEARRLEMMCFTFLTRDRIEKVLGYLPIVYHLDSLVHQITLLTS